MSKQTAKILKEIDKLIHDIENEKNNSCGVVGGMFESSKNGVINGLEMAKQIVINADSK